MLPNIINTESTIKQALERIDKLSGQTLFVSDNENRMLGSLTDGDIRRALIGGAKLEDGIENFMSSDFKFIKQNEFSTQLIKEIRAAKIDYVPLLSADKKIIDVLNLDE